MTELLQQVFEKASKLPVDQQMAIALYLTQLLNDPDGPFVPLCLPETVEKLGVTQEAMDQARKELGLL